MSTVVDSEWMRAGVGGQSPLLGNERADILSKVRSGVVSNIFHKNNNHFKTV